VLDLNLGPGHDGYPVAEALAARGLPFLFSTGYGRNGLHNGFRDRPVLTKPFKIGGSGPPPRASSPQPDGGGSTPGAARDGRRRQAAAP